MILVEKIYKAISGPGTSLMQHSVSMEEERTGTAYAFFKFARSI